MDWQGYGFCAIWRIWMCQYTRECLPETGSGLVVSQERVSDIQPDGGPVRRGTGEDRPDGNVRDCGRNGI